MQINLLDPDDQLALFAVGFMVLFLVGFLIYIVVDTVRDVRKIKDLSLQKAKEKLRASSPSYSMLLALALGEILSLIFLPPLYPSVTLFQWIGAFCFLNFFFLLGPVSLWVVAYHAKKRIRTLERSGTSSEQEFSEER